MSRHPSVEHFATLFAHEHLPPLLRAVSAPFGQLHDHLLDVLHDGPELSAALRKLLEAKDCAVRQAVLDARPEPLTNTPEPWLTDQRITPLVDGINTGGARTDDDCPYCSGPAGMVHHTNPQDCPYAPAPNPVGAWSHQYPPAPPGGTK